MLFSTYSWANKFFKYNKDNLCIYSYSFIYKFVFVIYSYLYSVILVYKLWWHQNLKFIYFDDLHVKVIGDDCSVVIKYTKYFIQNTKVSFISWKISHLKVITLFSISSQSSRQKSHQKNIEEPLVLFENLHKLLQ